MFDLFNLFGIRIRADWTILFLVLFLYQTGVWGIVAVLVVIIMHELGHALMVRRRGGHVEGIVLQGFGGMTLYQGIDTPIDRTVVAAAGPLVNLLTALLLWKFGPQNDFTYYLHLFSLILGIFNCLPILPLDGGHVLEGLLCLKTNAHKARLWSLYVSRIGSLGLVVLALAFNQILVLILGGIFFYMAHKEISQLSEYSSGAGLWERFQQSRQQKSEKKKEENDLAVKSRVDQLLAKISTEGMSSLTQEEREFLNKASDRFKS